MSASNGIVDVLHEQPQVVSGFLGDTWDPAWASDGNLYFLGNDGSGWKKACASNLFFNRASGDDYHSLIGETLNPMVDYGGWAEQGPDGCTWKSSGALVLDDVIYLALARHCYGTKSGDMHMRQTAARASIIRSIDWGRTWERSAQENYEQPMFADPRFATPYFVHYGQDGSLPGVDGSDNYVYAVSNNGFWCNGDSYILGRVEREKIGCLEAADWQFYCGGDGNRVEAWSDNLDRALKIIESPLQCGETGMTYLPEIDRYILVAWYYPGNPNIDTDLTRFVYWEAPKPWGPWRKVKELDSAPHGWYCPRVLSKWQTMQDGELQAVLVTGGDYYEMSKYYNFTVLPLRINTQQFYPDLPQRPAPVVIGHAQVGSRLNTIGYSGGWEVKGGRPKALDGSEHFSSQPGAGFTLNFAGKRIRWFTSKENNLGIAAVSLDGGEETLVDLYTYCVVPQFGRLVFDSDSLDPGPHTLQVRVTGLKNEKSIDVWVSNDRIEIDPD